MFPDNERMFINEKKQHRQHRQHSHTQKLKDYLFLKETQQFLRKLSSHLKSSKKRNEKKI